jgi:hypothetical protein
MVSSCSRAVLWSTCPTVGVGNPASILESVRPPKSAEAHGTGTGSGSGSGSGSTGRFPLESGPSLSLRGGIEPLGVLLCKSLSLGSRPSLSLVCGIETVPCSPLGACPLGSGPSLSLRGESSLLESSCARACPLGLDRACPLCAESRLSLVVLLEPVPWCGPSLESGPSLSLRGGSSLLESSCARACPLGLDRACPLCAESRLSLVVLLEPVPWGFGPSLSLGFVIPKEFPNPTLTGSGEVP